MGLRAVEKEVQGPAWSAASCEMNGNGKRVTLGFPKVLSDGYILYKITGCQNPKRSKRI
jgi:hypothetical protein